MRRDYPGGRVWEREAIDCYSQRRYSTVYGRDHMQAYTRGDAQAIDGERKAKRGKEKTKRVRVDCSFKKIPAVSPRSVLPTCSKSFYTRLRISNQPQSHTEHNSSSHIKYEVSLTCVSAIPRTTEGPNQLSNQSITQSAHQPRFSTFYCV